MSAAAGRSFDAVAALYDEVRPDYPGELYDAVAAVLGGWRGRAVLDLAAGPGVATRQLVARGASAVALEPGAALAARLHARSPEVPVVRAVAERLPFAPAAFDVVCCATAWHWVDASSALGEIRRVLRPGGHLVLWWANHRSDDAVAWEAAQAEVFARWRLATGSRPPTPVGVGPREAAAHLRAAGWTVAVERELTWQRVVPTARHLSVLATHSDLLVLGERRHELLAEVAQALAPWDQVTERLWGPLVVAAPTPPPRTQTIMGR